jgi:hypothetical protein
MCNGENVRVTREWAAEDGHVRIEGDTVSGERNRTYFFKKRDFLDAAEHEVRGGHAP